MSKIILVLRILVAIILVQTLYFKFTGHADSKFIFSQVGLEPYGRIGIGVLELISAILLLMPKTIWAGAMLTLGIISGAVMMHLTQIGIEVNGDGGTLFYMAVFVLLASFIILWHYRKDIPIIGDRF